jgi:hypothetical protein
MASLGFVPATFRLVPLPTTLARALVIHRLLGVISQRIKRPRRKADHSPPYSDKIKNHGAIPSRPHLLSLHGA